MQRCEIMPFAKGEAQAVSERLRALGHGGLFTFNGLVATWEWSQELPPADASVA